MAMDMGWAGIRCVCVRGGGSCWFVGNDQHQMRACRTVLRRIWELGRHQKLLDQNPKFCDIIGSDSADTFFDRNMINGSILTIS